ncbi:MAG: hypothetical protein OXJ53_07070 [Gammaproteobacteria bacterium]|nr:hypothetical protein [Gammaproteobacteria bacterium]MDE0269778.1 hypothetical protein [Gammaproteobacteria bacterium]
MPSRRRCGGPTEHFFAQDSRGAGGGERVPLHRVLADLIASGYGHDGRAVAERLTRRQAEQAWRYAEAHRAELAGLIAAALVGGSQ